MTAESMTEPGGYAEPLLPLDEGEGPALPLAEAAQRAIVAQLMVRVRRDAVVRRRGLRPGHWIAAGVLLAGAAAAVSALRTRAPAAESNSLTPADTSAPRRIAAIDRESADAPPPPEPAVTSDRAPALAPLMPDPANRVQTKTALSNHTADAPTTAVDRLEQANLLRRGRRYPEALHAYLTIVGEFPGSLQAQAARVAAADLQLDTLHNADEAEKLYAEAQRRGGPLSAEAAWGLAQSYRSRGDVAKERQSLNEFLAKYPQSPLASQARQNLQTLSKR